jgi:hypothetical protein
MGSTRARALAVAGAVLALAACGVPAPPPPLPAGCVARDPGAAARALASATGGTTVCLHGDGFRGADLVVASPGTVERPVVLRAPGVTVRSVTVTADHVVVEGVTTEAGDGIVLGGTGLVVRDSTVRDAVLDGISCEVGCRDVVIERNTVTGTDGTGIIVEGEDIAVRDNLVSGSVRRRAGDADGIRFFGLGISITGNTVTDIKDDGYDDPPHTDCFQTYDNSRIPTVDAVIENNVCRNVDHQCLIATAEESGRGGEIGRSRGIEFTGNVCDVEGSQAVLVQWLPEVTVRGNSFAGPGLDRAAIFLDGSTGAGFYANTVPAGVVAYEVDETSSPGFGTDRRQE